MNPQSNLREQAVSFGGQTALSGIVTLPDELPEGQPRRAIILLNAGTTHRVGPSRLYVRIARRLARAGIVGLRFDQSGIGDSPVRRDGLPYAESVALEVREAMDFLEREHGVTKFMLTGICSGAATAFVVARHDPRVDAALLINATSHFHEEHPEQLDRDYRRALIRHSWRIALFSSFRGKNWRKLLGGQLDPKRIASMLFGRGPKPLAPTAQIKPSSSPSPRTSLNELTARGVALLHLYSEGDEGLDYFRTMLGSELKALERAGQLQLRVLKGVNHLFTQLWTQELLLDLVEEWAHEVRGREALA